MTSVVYSGKERRHMSNFPHDSKKSKTHYKWINRKIAKPILGWLFTSSLALVVIHGNFNIFTKQAAAALVSTQAVNNNLIKNYTSAVKTVSQVKLQSNVILNVPLHKQDYPLSCEAAALQMALNYKGISVNEKQIMSSIGYDTTPHVGNTWGNPHEAFVGNIWGRQPTTGYGVYWEPIAKAGGQYRPSQYFTNGNIQTLTSQIVKGNPVVVWGNLASGRHIDWRTPSGQRIVAISGEHALTVRGFLGPQNNPTAIVYNDPHSGKMVTQSVSKFNTQWKLLGNAGVIVG